jgi:hypothetical protein
VLALRGDTLYQLGKRQRLWCRNVLIETLALREAQTQVAMDYLGHATLVRRAGENNAPCADGTAALLEALIHPFG